MSDFPAAGSTGPTVGPDKVGPASPAWIITGAGHTGRGWPWFVVRKRGGRMVRVNVHAAQATTEGALAAVEAAVASLPDLPGPNVY